MWLNRLRKRPQRREFSSRVITDCRSLLDKLLESEDDTTRDTFQKSMSFKNFDIIRERGSEAVDDFRQAVNEGVFKIVQDDDPVKSMRKELMRMSNVCIMHQLFISEEFQDRRQELYDMFGSSFEYARQEWKPAEPVDNFDDWVVAVMVLRSEAHLVILRSLQMTYFEEVGKDDWFKGYWDSCTVFYRALYRRHLGFTHIDGCTLDDVFLEAMKTLEELQQELIGEIIFPLWAGREQ